eukprot:EG_transcript_25877
MRPQADSTGPAPPSVEGDSAGRPSPAAVPVLGAHRLVDLAAVGNAALLNDAEALRRLFEAASAAGKFTILPSGSRFHQFTPQGVTGMVLLAESHMSIHTWPEHRAAAIDIFTCGLRHRPQDALQVLLDELRPGSVNVTTVHRPVSLHSRQTLQQDTHEALLWTSPCFVVALLAPLSLFLCWLAGAGRRSITRTKQL